MGNGAIKQMKAMVRIGCVTCEIPLFPPGIGTFPNAPPTEVFHCSAAQSRGQLGKVEVAIRGIGNEKSLEDGGLEICAFVETGSKQWELGNGSWKWGNAT